MERMWASVRRKGAAIMSVGGVVAMVVENCNRGRRKRCARLNLIGIGEWGK